MFGDDFGSVGNEPFMPVLPSSIARTWQSHGSPTLYSKPFLMNGVIAEVYPPDHTLNRTKTQYEYLVSASGEAGTFKPIHALVEDKFGGNNDFETYTLRKNQKVVVQCIMGSPVSGVILGGLRNLKDKIDVNLGHHWMRRFNNITESITKDSTKYIKHKDGDEIRVEPTKIILKDGEGEEITIDKAAKKITIKDASGQSIVIDQKSGQITVTGKELNLKVEGDVNLQAGGEVTVDASAINLNGSSGQVLTTSTHGVDYVTGLPIFGTPTVKAG